MVKINVVIDDDPCKLLSPHWAANVIVTVYRWPQSNYAGRDRVLFTQLYWTKLLSRLVSIRVVVLCGLRIFRFKRVAFFF